MPGATRRATGWGRQNAAPGASRNEVPAFCRAAGRWPARNERSANGRTFASVALQLADQRLSYMRAISRACLASLSRKAAGSSTRICRPPARIQRRVSPLSGSVTVSR